MIEVRDLSKSFGPKLAVDSLNFDVKPGRVTGFLGPNGAGKSTTMRMIIGLDSPSSGSATVNGRRYFDHPAPLCQVGALLEAKAVHTSRSARNHLRALAATHGISKRRVEQMVDLVGLTEVAGKRAGSFSLGMGQRLGVAAALLGDPDVLVLDEPVNGLDPEGVRWVRELLKAKAAEGRTVFVSSHLMSEMAQTAEHVIVIGRGRLLADTSISELISGASATVVSVRTPEASRLAGLLGGDGAKVSTMDDQRLEVHGLPSARIGEIALAAGIVLHELTPQQASLEEAFMEMTAGTVEFHAGPSGGNGSPS